MPPVIAPVVTFDGTSQVYLVLAGAKDGDRLKLLSEHIEIVVSLIAATGFTLTVMVKLVPTQPLALGVMV